ncbi:amino acid adenylation domain-containing protein [Spongiibacter taiwanensis]|uniref:amino acid adenylation domain-containing protein n=1 Tax=Spongiibacter taiwanensis TaxID=1748242 RepID=UPI002034B941|nr:amino acid adenylation domain-containing protein [Spongiibacter taiwanensis]USA42854.1 amino acid adenylation domain-containing protein [Spongiibacter taiwanensis]
MQVQLKEARYREVPLSIAQRSMWVSDKISADDVVFNLAEYVEFFASVDPQLFVAVIKQVAEEADPWRTQIVETGGGPVQRISAEGYREVPYFDYSDRACAAEDAVAWMRAELHRPVDPSVDPLWCCALFKIGPERFFWYHRSHHAILDGFGASLISRRVAQLYNAISEGRVPPASPFLSAETQLDAERDYQASSRRQRDQAYWLERMTDLADSPSLAVGGGLPSGGLRRSSLVLSRECYGALKANATHRGHSLPQLMIALLASYIYRLTGVDDLVIVMPVSARLGASQRATPGMFANAVALRLQMSADMSMTALLQQVAKVVRSALRHQQYRYETLRRELGLLGQGKQIAWLGINIEPFDYRIGLGGRGCAIHNLSNGTVDDLTFFVYDRGDEGGLRVDLDANPGLYSQSALDGHRDRLDLMINHFWSEPEIRVSDLHLIPPEEYRRLLVEWNGPSVPPTLSLIKAFENHAQFQAAAPALHWRGGSLSYGALNGLANQFAHALADEDVGEGDLVAVLLPREPILLVALLGILKSGAAYLPLDLTAPALRQQHILEDAEPAVLISHSSIDLPQCRARVVLTDLMDLALYADTNPPHWDGFDAPAYVIYTSGSTGRPKGVIVSHDNVANFLFGIGQVVPLSSKDRLLAMTTVAFDIAGLELFLPLMKGGQVVLCDRDSARDPAAVAALVKDQGVSVIQATPSHWRVLLPEMDGEMGHIRALVGGEALPGELATQLHRSAAAVVNLYGPTETTIWSTAMPIGPADLANPPIGRPLANTQVYVLDSTLRLAPTGAVGELYIGGYGVAVGYLRRAELTAQRFIANPFGPGRLYRTGDQARWRSDGVLEYLGRNDFQIKVRGYRVEAEEVARQLEMCPGVRQAVVVLREDGRLHSRLVAYYQRDESNGAQPSAEALRRTLAARLPDYMVPAHFEPLASLPLNVNGKLDRNALPEPRWQTADPEQPPRTPLEQTIAEIWQETFARPILSVNTSFFDLGGDSLMAAKVVGQLRTTLRREIPLVVMFEADTIAKLAQRLLTVDGLDPLASLITLREVPGAPALFCAHPVVGLGWAFGALLPHLPDELSVYALQSPGLSPSLTDVSPPITDLPGLAGFYLDSLRAKQSEGPYRLLGWSMGGAIVYEMARQLRLAGDQVELVAMLDAYPFTQRDRAEDWSSAHLVSSALAFLNIAPASGELWPQTLDQLADWLSEIYDIHDTPVVAELLRSDPGFLQRLRSVVEKNLGLLRAYSPGELDSDLLFFEALEGAEDTSGVVDHHPEVWARQLKGKLERVGIACHHQAMLDPEPARQIGRELGQRLSTAGKSAANYGE